MPTTLPKELYTAKSISTLGGASIAVLVASSAMGYAFNFNPRWLGLVFAELIAGTGLWALRKDTAISAGACLIALLNGTLIYCQAIGLNTLNHAVPSGNVGQSNTATLVPLLDRKMWWPSAEARELQAAAKDAAAKLETASTELQQVQENLQAIQKRQDELNAASERSMQLIETSVASIKQNPGRVNDALTQLTTAQQLLVRSPTSMPAIAFNHSQLLSTQQGVVAAHARLNDALKRQF